MHLSTIIIGDGEVSRRIIEVGYEVTICSPNSDLRELRPASWLEIEVFGKPVIAKMAALECGATLEDEKLTESALAQAN